ncbi:hypothetical protein Tco_1009718 [Tanacetum coccineum]
MTAILCKYKRLSALCVHSAIESLKIWTQRRRQPSVSSGTCSVSGVYLYGVSVPNRKSMRHAIRQMDYVEDVVVGMRLEVHTRECHVVVAVTTNYCMEGFTR